MAIDGITVLNVIEHTVRGFSLLNGWSILFGLFASAILMITIYLDSKTINDDTSTLLIPFILCIMLCFIFGTNAGPIKDHYYTYQVTIDDSVKFNEFVQHYQVINQEGLIYEIREIESDID